MKRKRESFVFATISFLSKHYGFCVGKDGSRYYLSVRDGRGFDQGIYNPCFKFDDMLSKRNVSLKIGTKIVFNEFEQSLLHSTPAVRGYWGLTSEFMALQAEMGKRPRYKVEKELYQNKKIMDREILFEGSMEALLTEYPRNPIDDKLKSKELGRWTSAILFYLYHSEEKKWVHLLGDPRPVSQFGIKREKRVVHSSVPAT